MLHARLLRKQQQIVTGFRAQLLKVGRHLWMTTNVRTRTAPARRHDGTNGCVGLDSLAGHLVLSERAVNAAIRAITVRRFGKRAYSAAQLVAQGALPEHVRQEAERVLHTRRNILVSGGTGSGKTTLLNALIELLPDDERIVAIEDTLKLRIDSPNCVRFEARGVQHPTPTSMPERSGSTCGCGPERWFAPTGSVLHPVGQRPVKRGVEEAMAVFGHPMIRAKVVVVLGEERDAQVWRG